MHMMVQIIISFLFKWISKVNLSHSRQTAFTLQAVAIDIKDTLSLFPVVLAWEDVQVKVYTGDATAFKTVIHKCSGMFLPSEFVAIMGPSGAGKLPPPPFLFLRPPPHVHYQDNCVDKIFCQ